MAPVCPLTAVSIREPQGIFAGRAARLSRVIVCIAATLGVAQAAARSG